MKPDAIDQSWGRADPDALRAAGVQVVAGYLSYDESGKNIEADYVKQLHARGIGVVLNWESQPGAPLNGKAQGHEDAVEACKQAKALLLAVGDWTPRTQPKWLPTWVWNRTKLDLVIPFSCDLDAHPAGPVTDYYRAAQKVCHSNGFGAGAYGSYRVIEYLMSAGVIDSAWQTYAWSMGQVSTKASLYQFLNGQHLGGAGVDYNKILNAVTLGAWWPANAGPNRPLPPAATEGFDSMKDTEIRALFAHQEAQTQAALDFARKVLVSPRAHVQESVDSLLAERLLPIQKQLNSIQTALAGLTTKGT